MRFGYTQLFLVLLCTVALTTVIGLAWSWFLLWCRAYFHGSFFGLLVAVSPFFLPLLVVSLIFDIRDTKK